MPGSCRPQSGSIGLAHSEVDEVVIVSSFKAILVMSVLPMKENVCREGGDAG